METKTTIYELRTKMGLSQEDVAEKVFVTRQAVSRWENGDTLPNIDTLKLLSELSSAAKRMVRSIPTTASGATPTGRLHIPIWRS